MKKIMENTREFKTNDFYISCVLKTVGFPLLRLDRGAAKFVVFVFDDPEYEAEITIDRYWNRQIKVAARDLIENVNELKTRLHSGV